eukprot:CAMPEP_0203924102 /NCGR_PEP_ID=MMETSP0359-20131031/63903_1 /ASSEMBLY_ACC=CAM_ASM_000338 /TAXON_ID=268821 /ORGANISM="Scrippsiella Hangoei, Strain SHTV-5" /LENGTH=39 /DNA_ID= /DNA_START= /DNA_END= /DNA_ORIENTATION=
MFDMMSGAKSGHQDAEAEKSHLWGSKGLPKNDSNIDLST